MFCTSLSRQAFAAVIPKLTALPLSLRESRLDTHDLEIPFGSDGAHHAANRMAARHLRVLLLSANEVREPIKEDTIRRVQHFAALTGGYDLLIVFLLNVPPTVGFGFVLASNLVNPGEAAASSDGIHGYAKLQAEMINHSEIPYIPILPLSNIDHIQQLLQRHVSNLSRTIQHEKSLSTSLHLLQQCTASPPMSQQTVYILSDLFADLKELAGTCSNVTSALNSSSPSTRAAGISTQMTDISDFGRGMGAQLSDSNAASKLKTLRDLVGDQECRDIVDFWKEEWTVD